MKAEGNGSKYLLASPNGLGLQESDFWERGRVGFGLNHHESP